MTRSLPAPCKRKMALSSGFRFPSSQHHRLKMPLSIFEWYHLERNKFKEWRDGLLHKFVGMMGEEAPGLVPVIFMYALLLVASVDAQEEKPARAQEAPEFLQNRLKRLRRYMQQTVNSVDGIERGRRKDQAEEVHDVCYQALGAAELDHGRREIGASHVQAVLLEEQAIGTCAGPDF